MMTSLYSKSNTNKFFKEALTVDSAISKLEDAEQSLRVTSGFLILTSSTSKIAKPDTQKKQNFLLNLIELEHNFMWSLRQMLLRGTADPKGIPNFKKIPYKKNQTQFYRLQNNKAVYEIFEISPPEILDFQELSEYYNDSRGLLFGSLYNFKVLLQSCKAKPDVNAHRDINFEDPYNTAQHVINKLTTFTVEDYIGVSNFSKRKLRLKSDLMA